MNNLQAPKLLAKASNCFYIQLDEELNLVNTNEYFQKIIFGSGAANKRSIYAFFPEADQPRWKEIFTSINSQPNEVQAFTAPFLTNLQTFEIEWNIAPIFKDQLISGYELLGIILKRTATKSIDKTAIQHSAKMETRLKAVLVKLKKILDSSLDVICVFDENGRFTNVSAASTKVFGYNPKELIGKKYFDYVHVDDVEKTLQANTEIKNGSGITNFENRYYKKDGSIAYLMWSSKWEAADKRYYCIARDATEKKASEEALKNSEEKYKILFYLHPLPMWIYDNESFNFLEVNDAAITQYGYSREAFLKMKVSDIVYEYQDQKFLDYYQNKGYVLPGDKGLVIHKTSSNGIMYVEMTSNEILYSGRKAKVELSIDRTEIIQAEVELIKSNEKYVFLSEATFDAIWDWDITTGTVQWNEGVRKMFEMPELSMNTSVEWWLNHLHPEDLERVQMKLNNHIESKLPNWEDEYRFKIGDNSYKYIFARGYIIYDPDKNAVRMIGAMQDLTERKGHETTLQKLNNSLEKRARELAESNAELERFAYVASHDLQEPLRMVTSFLQLIEKRYKDKLDQKAHEYIHYAVDGAERMKRLILDLLEYSKVNSSKLEKENVDVNEIVSELRIVYRNLINSNNGTINAGPLPQVRANRTQLMQLFQNLVGNAFKYRSEKPVVIDINFKEEPKDYYFSIADNGIGIDPKFFSKIFIIFQRLHNREQYSGTGIGLAICKKIVDKHGGRIWVTSTVGNGSTFHFTLPKSK